MPTESNPYAITFENEFSNRTFVITSPLGEACRGASLQPSSCDETSWSCLRIRSSTGSISGRLKVTSGVSSSTANCPTHCKFLCWAMVNRSRPTSHLRLCQVQPAASCSFRLDSLFLAIMSSPSLELAFQQRCLVVQW